MGVTITADFPSGGSSYDQFKVYRATSKTGTYTLLATQNLTDLTYFDADGTSSHWYKVTYYVSSTTKESGYTAAMNGSDTTYTTVKKVEGLLQLPTALTDSTKPTIQQVTEIISRIEDKIDGTTNHAWRQRYSGTKSGKNNTANWEYQPLSMGYQYGTGIPVYLGHRMIRALSAAAGDALERWTGAAWEDWLAKTESRDGDFWLDYEMGVLYIKTVYVNIKDKGIRIKYRYGDTVVDGTVEDIATKMVATEVLAGDRNSSLLPEGSTALRPSEMVEQWKDEIKEDLRSIREMSVIPLTF